MIIDPHATTYGELINIAKLKADMHQYLAIAEKEELGYEYMPEGDCKPIFITGHNLEEQELPVWEHPLILKGMDGNTYIVTDVRKLVKLDKNGSRPGSLSSVVRDAAGLEFVTLRALLTRDLITEKLGDHRNIYKNLSVGMGSWLSNIVNGLILLDPVEKAYVEVVINFYANTMYYTPESLPDMIDGICARVAKSNLSIKFTKKTVDGLVAKLEIAPATLDTLVSYIHAVIPDEKAQYINTNSIVTNMGNVWYGPGNSGTVLISLEHVPTWMALVYVNLENKSYKKTRLATMLDKSSRAINPKEIILHTTAYLRDNIL